MVIYHMLSDKQILSDLRIFSNTEPLGDAPSQPILIIVVGIMINYDAEVEMMILRVVIESYIRIAVVEF